MTVKPAGPPASRDAPHRDIESLIRAIHVEPELGGVAFRFLGSRTDAEDAVQSAYIKVLGCWAKVGGFETVVQQRTYLVKTVTNEALQIRRRAHRRREVLAAGESGTEPGWVPEFPGGERQEFADGLRHVWRAISELPEENRGVVLLFAAGYEYAEIAGMLDISASTVRSHVSSARRRLRLAIPPEREE